MVKNQPGDVMIADFWATIDGNKLAQVGQREKEMDLVGPTKKAELVNVG